MHKQSSILLHDFYSLRGGGERLTLDLVNHLSTDLCFGYYKSTTFALPFYKKNAIFNLNAYTSIPGWKSVKLINAFRHNTRFISDYKVAIYSGNDAPLASIHRPGKTNIFYCHTPPRFVYDKKDYFLQKTNPLTKPLHHSRIRIVKKLYEDALENMNIILANSFNTKQRIKRYLGLNAEVVYPPCNTSKFKWIDQDDYYLSTARLDPLKRVDKIVKAFINMPDKKLIVASGGKQYDMLRRLAKDADNISFTGWVSDEKLKDLLGKCIATIYIPKDEDFGMSPLESMSAGKPVIGIAEGGLKETIINHQTGILLTDDFGLENIIEAVNTLTTSTSKNMKDACEKQARQFDTRIFIDKFKSIIQRYEQ